LFTKVNYTKKKNATLNGVQWPNLVWTIVDITKKEGTCLVVVYGLMNIFYGCCLKNFFIWQQDEIWLPFQGIGLHFITWYVQPISNILDGVHNWLLLLKKNIPLVYQIDELHMPTIACTT